MNEALQQIASDRLGLAISPMGAQLRAIRTMDGRELLWSADPHWWGFSCPLLFPIVGGLNENHYSLDGKRFHLAKHGFARKSLFEAVTVGRDHALFRLSASDETRAVYPFEFTLDVSFRVEDRRIEIAATLSNPGPVALPASFGFHPAFRWPLTPAQDRGEHSLVFDQDEPDPISKLNDDGTLSPERLPTPVRERTLVLRDALFAHGLVYGAPGGPKLRIEFPGLPYLGVWTKPGAPFVCIEPWQGLADPEGYAGDLRAKPGVIEVMGGQSRTFAFSVTVME
jgi:galactose mutarotase-like enzyme